MISLYYTYESEQMDFFERYPKKIIRFSIIQIKMDHLDMIFSEQY